MRKTNGLYGPSGTAIEVAPRTSWYDVYGTYDPAAKTGTGIRGALGATPTVAATKLGAVAPIAGFGDDYFQSLMNESRNAMNREFYGRGGMTQKAEETMASRGMLGSTIEGAAKRDINQTFGEKMGSLLGDIGRMKTEKGIELARDTRNLQQERDLKGAAMDLEAGMKNADLESAYKELGLRSSLTEAADATKYGLGMFEQQVGLEEAKVEQQNAKRQALVDMLSNPEIANSMTDEERQSILNTIQTIGSSGGMGMGSPFNAEFPGRAFNARGGGSGSNQERFAAIQNSLLYPWK